MKKADNKKPNSTLLLGAIIAIVVGATFIFTSRSQNTVNLKKYSNSQAISPSPITLILPTATEKELAGFRSYRNDYYSIKYPVSYQPKEISFSTRPEYPTALSSVEFRSNSGHLFTVTVTQNFKNLALDGVLGNGPYFSYTKEALARSKMQKIVINGVEGVMAENVEAGLTSPNTDVIFITGGKIYQIMSAHESNDDNTFMHILQTLTIKM